MLHIYVCVCVYNLLPDPQISPFSFFALAVVLTLPKRNPEAEYNAVASRTALASFHSGSIFVPPKKSRGKELGNTYLKRCCESSAEELGMRG